MTYTRRDLGKVGLAALSGARLWAKPNSKFGGVQVGTIAPYSFRAMSDSNNADVLLKRLVDLAGCGKNRQAA